MKIVLQDYEDVEIEMDNEIYYLKKESIGFTINKGNKELYRYNGDDK